MECPECGKEREFSSVEIYQNCHYTFRYDDVANYEPQDLVFTVKFRCKNCGDDIKWGFSKKDKVWPKGAGPNFQLNETTGNPYLASVNGNRCWLQCPTCEIDTSLYEINRVPIRER